MSADKVTLQLRAVGDAPVLKNKKFQVNPAQTVSGLLPTLTKMLGLNSGQSLFLYISQTFAPSPDHTFQILRDCYGIGEENKELIIYYSITQAFG